MSLYRVLRPLQKGNQKIMAGDFILGDTFAPDALEKLTGTGAIAMLYAPPLSELPDFDGADQLATIGIVQADQFLEADVDNIAPRLSVDKSIIRQWRVEVANWLIIPVRAGG